MEYWNDGNNQKTTRFFDKAIDVFNQDFIDVLRISDFNTTGLTGSDKDYNSAWQNLVKSSGVSNKCGTSGGSFGIGKSAPFACSDLRTVFYSTIDNQGLKAFQGIARLVSFKKKKFIGDDPTTTGIGYYGVKEKIMLSENVYLLPMILLVKMWEQMCLFWDFQKRAIGKTKLLYLFWMIFFTLFIIIN